MAAARRGIFSDRQPGDAPSRSLTCIGMAGRFAPPVAFALASGMNRPQFERSPAVLIQLNRCHRTTGYQSHWIVMP
jgi:hypothetical protein